MYCPNYSAEGLDTIISSTQNEISTLLSDLFTNCEEVLYERDSDISRLAREQAAIFLIVSGEVALTLDNKSVLMYEVGDIAGLEALMPIPCLGKANEFAIKAKKLSLNTIEEKLGKGTVTKLLSQYAALIFRIFSSSLPSGENNMPQLQRYENGEVIVVQGTAGDEIFTLIEGHADVFVDNKIVGEIKCDEVFGALAAMTNMGRTATIVSRGQALVLAIKKERLIELIKSRPGTIEKLIGDLSRVIQDLNTQLSQRI